MDDDDAEPDSRNLQFKPITLKDKPFLAKLLTNPHIAQNFIKGSEYVDHEIDDILDSMLSFWINNHLGFYVVYSNDQEIGLAGFNYLSDHDEVEVVYCVDEQFWGQGLASTMLQKLLEIGFTEFQLPRLMGIVKKENQASYKVLQRSNFNFVKEFNEKNQDYILLELINPYGKRKTYRQAREVGL